MSKNVSTLGFGTFFTCYCYSFKNDPALLSGWKRGVAIAGALLLGAATLGAIPAACYYLFSQDRAARIQRAAAQAMRAYQDPWAAIRSDEPTLRSQRHVFEASNPANAILGKLFLGSQDEFATVLHRDWQCQVIDEDTAERTLLPTHNEHGYSAVVTVCQTETFAGSTGLQTTEDMPVRLSVLPDDPDHVRNVILPEWVHIGQTALEPHPERPAEAERFWRDLVAGAETPLCLEASVPGVDLAQRAMTELMDQNGVDQHLQPNLNLTAVANFMPYDPERHPAFSQALPGHVEDYFKAVFQVMDRAVFGNEKVLVHCQQGRSRSSAVVIAYLINRFQLTFGEALRFVQSSRPSVEPKLAMQLDRYAADLARARMSRAMANLPTYPLAAAAARA